MQMCMHLIWLRRHKVYLQHADNNNKADTHTLRFWLLPTVSHTVSYSMVSRHKNNITTKCEMKWLFLVWTHCPKEKRPYIHSPANWLKWFSRTGQGELLMWGCLGLNDRQMARSQTIKQEAVVTLILFSLSFLTFPKRKCYKPKRYSRLI